jgi:plastocyanin
MKNTSKVLGIICFLFPILILWSCNPTGSNAALNKLLSDTVIIQQMQFIPAILDVKPGDTVVWINKGLVDHNITEQKNQSWSSDTLHAGKSWKKVITDSVDYFCTIHPTMKGKIRLK